MKRALLFDSLVYYAIRVRPQSERLAEEVLHRDGHYVYLPLEHRWRRRGRYTKRRELAQFPLLIGYIFVGFPPGPVNWYSLCRFRFVQSVVGHDGEPFAIPGAALAKVLKAERISAPSKVPTSHRTFKAGDTVKYLDHPVKVEEIRGEKARVLFEMFASIREIEIPLWQLEAAAS